MIIAVAQSIILIVAVAVCAACAWGIFRADRLTGIVKDIMDKRWGMYIAVGVRVVLGTALIIAASGSRLPIVFMVIGSLSLLAAAVLPFLGRARIRALLGWIERGGSLLMRVWLVFGFLFGAFLIYGIT